MPTADAECDRLAALYICRHGQDEDNVEGLLNGHRDRPLTALGREQAIKVAENIHALTTQADEKFMLAAGKSTSLTSSGTPPFDVILSSPLQRAHDTAKAIAAAVSLPVVVKERLIERDFGDLSGTPLIQIEARVRSHVNELLSNGGKKNVDDYLFHTEKVCYFLDGPGSVESFEKCLYRAKELLADMCMEYPGKRVLCVCHGDIGKMLMAAATGMSWKHALAAPYIANTEVLRLA